MACTQIIDSYLINDDGQLAINGVGEGYGQAFANVNQHVLCAAKFLLLYTIAQNFSWVANLYACTGTPGSNGKPTGAALATSDTHDGSELALTKAWITHTFAAPYTLLGNTNYCIVVEITAYTSGNLAVRRDATTLAHAGNACYNVGAGWFASPTRDCLFEIDEEAIKIPVFQRQYRARRVE